MVARRPASASCELLHRPCRSLLSADPTHLALSREWYHLRAHRVVLTLRTERSCEPGTHHRRRDHARRGGRGPTCSGARPSRGLQGMGRRWWHGPGGKPIDRYTFRVRIVVYTYIGIHRHPNTSATIIRLLKHQKRPSSQKPSQSSGTGSTSVPRAIRPVDTASVQAAPGQAQRRTTAENSQYASS
jgi:hypothetical protein